VKTFLLLLLTTSFALLAQTPPSATDAGATAATNRDEQLRRALRQAIAGKTNAPNPVAVSNVPPANAAATNVPVQLQPVPALPGQPATSTQQPRVAAPLTPPATQPPTTLTLPAATAETPKTDETVAINPPPGSTVALAASEDEKVIGAGEISFAAVEIDKVLTIYAELVGRTVLRPTALPSPAITIRTQTPLTRREAVQALDSVLALNGVTMIPVGEKFVKAVPSTQAQTEGAAFSKLDVNELPEAGQYITHIAQLKYARPSEVVPVLQPFAKIPNSILPVETSQIVVIRDYAENVKRMLEMIKKIDITVPMEYEPVVIPIKYALAGDIASVLSSLTTGGGGGVVASGRSTRGPSASGRSGIGSRNYPGASATGTLATTVPGQPTAAPGAAGARGGSFTDRLQSIVNRAAQGGEFQIIGEAKIIPDERTNSLLIFANKQDLETIKNIVAKLDVVLAQVLIESIIMEVSLEDSRNVGVSYLARPNGNGYFTGAGAIKNRENFLDQGSFGGGAILTNLGLPSGFSYWARFGDDLDVTATAIAQDSTINVLARPRIQTSHAVQADLFIGNTVPYVTGTYFGGVTGTGSSSQYQQKDVGISLSVLPLINPDGLVVMDITQDIEQLGNPTIIDGNPVPTTTKRSAAAKVAVKDRETIILGGFISSNKSKSRSGVPFLKDIPVLGYLFRSTGDSTDRVELIVLMRPTVLPTPEAAATQAIAEQNKLPGIKQSKKEFDIDELKRLEKAEND